MKDRMDFLPELLKRLDAPEIVKTLSVQRERYFQLFLESLFEERLGSENANSVFENYTHTATCWPSTISARDLLNLDNTLLSLLPEEFDFLELSPLQPLGANNKIASTSQWKVFSSIKSAEVSADVALSLILEAARRRRVLEYSQNTSLAASLRCVRAQKMPSKALTPHFRVFGICSAHSEGIKWYAQNGLCTHIGFFIRLFQALAAEKHPISNVTILLSDLTITEDIIRKLKIDRQSLLTKTTALSYDFFKDFGISAKGRISVSEADTHIPSFSDLGVGEKYTNLVNIARNLVKTLSGASLDVSVQLWMNRIAGLGHHRSLCYKLMVLNPNKETLKPAAIVDGGVKDWPAKITGKKNELYLTSVFGTEHFLREFPRK